MQHEYSEDTSQPANNYSTKVYNTTTDSKVDSSRLSAVSMDKSERWGMSPERISQRVRYRNKRGVAREFPFNII